MKNFLLQMFTATLIVSAISSCSNSSGSSEKEDKVENSGDVIVENGSGGKDTVTYSCIGCSEMLPSKKEFDMLVKEASERTKNSLNFPLSFVPKDISITLIKEDSLISVKTNKKIKNVINVIIDYKYNAKNGYGNEIEGDGMKSFYLKDLKISDLEDEIKLEPLAYVDGDINRSLEVLNFQKTESIRLFPGNSGSIILVSSLGCVDEGTWLLLKLENGEEIKLISWNDFNCDGNSYFDELNTSQKEKLKTHKLKTITVVDDKSITCDVPLNQADYLQQFLAL